MTAADSGELLRRVRERLAEDPEPPTPERMAAALRAEARGVLGDTDVLDALRYLHTELVGVGRLEGVLADPAVTDVLVADGGTVWVDRGRGLQRADVRFDDEASIRRLATRLAQLAGRRLDDAQPWVDAQVADIGAGGASVRVHAVIPPIAVDGTCLSLRVLRPATSSLAGLAAGGAFPPEVRVLLESIVAARLAFLVVGGTGAGKTTLLGAMLGFVDPAERLVCVEDAVELAPQHPHVVRLAARTANVEGVGDVAVRTLVRQALRMRPDRIVVGEVRGAEVVDLLAALNTGHDGCAGTLHANTVAEVPARAEALAALGGLGRAALHSQLSAALQVVVGLHRGPDGCRRVREIGCLRRGDDGLVTVVPAWREGVGFTEAAPALADLIAERTS